MRTLRDLLWEGFEPTPEDVGRIMSRAAGLVRYGHDQGAVHGDLTTETLLVEHRGADWGVELAQPRQGTDAGATTADDVLALGRVLEQLVRAVPPDRLPDLFPAALASMTDADPAGRPQIAQVEQYFTQDYPDSLPADGPGSDRTTAVPVPPAPPPDEWRPSTAGQDTAYDGEDLIPLAEPGQERPWGRGAAVLVSVLVLLLGIGGLGFVVWRTLGADQEVVAAPETGPSDVDQDAEGRDGGHEGADETGTDGPSDETGTEQPEDGPTDEQSGSDEPSDDQAAEESADAGPTRPDVPVPTTPRSSAPRQPEVNDDHTNPDWEGGGWDAQALDDAYCRDGSTFIGLAGTRTYRGVICGHADGYSYRGLNKAANATLHASAEPHGDGWRAFGQGGVRYEFDEDTFTILDQRGSVLDEEDTINWLTPRGTPFRPGDLNLSQPITYPACDGSGVVVLGSWQGGGIVEQLVQDALDANPGSYYIRTDLACDNFNRPSSDLSEMNYIFSVLQPAGFDTGVVCAAIEEVGMYGYWLQEGVDPGIHIDCD